MRFIAITTAVVFGLALALQTALLAFPLPGSARLHALCLPTDWTCSIAESAAAVSTANATWWLIVATAAGAAATLAAVLVALGQDHRRTKAEDAERTRINRATKQAILNTYEFCRTVDAEVRAMTGATPQRAWDLYGKAEAHRRTIEHFLGTTITNDVLVFQSNAAIQRLFEVRTALDHVNNPENLNLEQAKATLQSVLRRISVDESDVLAANVAVIDGVTNVTVSATGSF